MAGPKSRILTTLEHRGCQLVPHVTGMLPQQTLKILNSDPTTHNTHAIGKNHRDWNQSQSPGTAALEQHFSLPELFISIRCNQHPWERAYVGVFSHPFFSVSATDGSYRISGLPPGQYTIVAWHEKFGEQTVDAFLAGSEQKNLDFTFKASDH
jgi:Carboxypeptidase regulatory-like domain